MGTDPRWGQQDGDGPEVGTMMRTMGWGQMQGGDNDEDDGNRMDPRWGRWDGSEVGTMMRMMDKEGLKIGTMGTDPRGE